MTDGNQVCNDAAAGIAGARLALLASFAWLTWLAWCAWDVACIKAMFKTRHYHYALP